jgi:RNA polymerase sigma-70 factor, ECF subfamily
VAVSGAPIDVLAERLATTRGALYKAIHDARQKLRLRLMLDGHQIGPPTEGARR